MKKHVVLLAALALIALLAMAETGMAEGTGTTVSGKLTSTITWSLSEGTLNIQGSGAAPNYEYPSSADPEPPWYKYRNEITHIVVGEGINSLGNYFFKNCENVVNVQLPSSLYAIGGAAFVGNSSLTQITIPDSVSSLSWDVFYNCTSLESVELPSSISSISSNVFYNTGDNLTIYGENNSYAQQYAKYNNISFVAQKKEESITSQPMLTNEDKNVYSQENDNGSNNRDVVSDNKKPLSHPTTIGSAIEKNVYYENDWELRTLEDGTREVVKFLNTEATEAVIPEGVSRISEGAFNDCTELMSITMDDWMNTFVYGNILLIPIQKDYTTYKTTYVVVRCVSFGHYPQTVDGTDDTPIQWIVLHKDGSKALLLSRYALDFAYYDTPNTMHSDGLCWENSKIRRWLNNEFLHKAFSEEEQNHILKTNVDNSEEQGYYDWTLSYNPDTVDQVFLLSVGEVTYYAADQVIRCCEPTPYMDCDENIVSWWLRSPGPHTLYPAVVTQEGEIGNSSTLWAGPVRPAIWVDLACIDGLSQTMSPLELYRTIGEAKRNEGLWDEAVQAFYRADDYEQVNATYYAKGMQKLSEGDTEGALHAFRGADGYGDAALKISEICYADGVAKRNEGDWDGAVKAFTDAGEYQDAAVQITETRYQQAQSLIAEKKNDDAISILKTIKDYKDSQTLMQMHCFAFDIISDEECCLTKYTGNFSEIVIPKCDENGRTVTRIGKYVFRDCESITKITIPDSITNLGSGTFWGCTSLTSITIPDGVSFIGGNLFQGCTSLTSITIPNSVTFIGGNAFAGCTSLASITILNGVTAIEYGAFSGCTSLTSITIPDSVTTIEGEAFSGCTSLADITIPDSITTIGEDAFAGCTSLASITIPNSVTVIEDGTFQNCASFTSITIPDSVTDIGASAFRGCTSLTDITIPRSVTSISKYDVFADCPSLNCIIVSPYISRAENYARENNLPYNYVNVNTAMAEDNSALWELRTLEDGTTEAVAFLNRMASEAVIPEGVTNFGGGGFGVFRGCTSLTSITIPDSVTIIRESAFSGSPLTSITIPDSVTTIEPYAFEYCFALTNITIPDSVTTIGDWAFHNCIALTSITIPESVTSIGEDLLGECTSLTSVIVTPGSYAEQYCKDNNLPYELLP